MVASCTESFDPTISSVSANLITISIIYFQGNLLLEDTIERYYYELEWAEEGLGLFLVRGENVVMLGELVPINMPQIIYLCNG